MKNWFARWFGGAMRPGAGAPATPAPAPALAIAPPLAATPGAEVDLAFYRWLTDAAGGDAAPAAQATERGILDGLARLAQAPGQAAELVPRVPAVIPELLRSLRDEHITGAELSRMVAQDLVLVAELIREANSPYYRSTTPVRNIEGAVMLLGQNGMRMLLARVAFRPIIGMQGGRFVKGVAPQVWAQSEKCALAASTLAPHLAADPFEAYLAGLVRNVGLIVAFRLIDQLHDNANGEHPLPRSGDFSAALLGHARSLTQGIARQWAFPDTVVDAIGGAAGAGSLGAVLATADVLSKLRLLVDAGVLDVDDPLVATHIGPRLRPIFDQLQPQEP